VWGNHRETTVDPEISKLDICAVATLPCIRRVKKGRLKVYTITLYKINKALETKNQEEKPLEEVIPKEYHKFLPLFSKVIEETLPPDQLYDYKIKLQEGFTLPFGPIYSIS
jgi:hypothetical protein